MIEISCKKRLNQHFTLDANLQINNGDFVTLFGNSGSGKTTLLRILAGFIKSQSGYAKNNDFVYFDDKYFTPPQKRNIGFLFQDYALFPNMSVFENLMFAKKDKKLANELLELSELEKQKNASISSLSGGQKQRVALARALMRRPDLLLLDEPFSALDTAIKTKLQDYLQKIHSNFKNTIILVSHDISEVYKLSKKVFLMDDGKIVKFGTPHEIFAKSSGSQKFSFNAKILEISQNDTIFIALLQVGNQINLDVDPDVPVDFAVPMFILISHDSHLPLCLLHQLMLVIFFIATSRHEV